jgi:hypothetical protein
MSSFCVSSSDDANSTTVEVKLRNIYLPILASVQWEYPRGSRKERLLLG